MSSAQCALFGSVWLQGEAVLHTTVHLSTACWNVVLNSQLTTLILTLIGLHTVIIGMVLITSSKQIPQLGLIPSRPRSLTPCSSPLWSAAGCFWRRGRTFGHWRRTPPRIHLPSSQAPPGCICCSHSDTAKVDQDIKRLTSSIVWSDSETIKTYCSKLWKVVRNK